MKKKRDESRAKGRRSVGGRRSLAAHLEMTEQLYRDFLQLTPHRFVPLVRSFASFKEYER